MIEAAPRNPSSDFDLRSGAAGKLLASQAPQPNSFNCAYTLYSATPPHVSGANEAMTAQDKGLGQLCVALEPEMCLA